MNYRYLLSALIPASLSAATIAGLTLDPARVPVPGATVRLSSAAFNATATTAPDGRFLFENIPAGDYTLTALSAGLGSPQPLAIALNKH